MYKLYNRCPNKPLADLLSFRKEARVRLSQKAIELFGEDAESHITYFPAEEKYMAFAWVPARGHRKFKFHRLTGFQENVIQCSTEAVKWLESMKDCQ